MAGGVKKLLNTAAKEDINSYAASSKSDEIISKDKTNSKGEDLVQISPNTTKAKNHDDSDKSTSKKAKKSKVGRPTKASKGEKTRKQYTLTLEEDDYARFMEEARKNKWSFASFMEEAAKEYIKNHK